MKAIASIIGIFVAFIIFVIVINVLAAAWGIVTIPWLTFTSRIQMNRDIVTKTYNADNALYNYHWFQEKHGEINAADQNYTVNQQAVVDFEASAGPRTSWTFEDKTEDARLRAVAQGNKNYYNTLVNEYNARAKEADRAIFVDGLPLFFNLK